jgi:lipopolysaccharide transport system ATP-binding protein
MTIPRVEVRNVWKKFRRGERHNSLRDLLPALARRWLGRGPARGELRAGDFWALRDVSFQVRPGEALGIIGPNGAGKSTLLKVLSRILRPDRGALRVHGRLGALIEVAAGFHPDLTGRENVFLNGAILGMKRREIERRLDAIIDFSGIEAFIDTPVKRYSSGMQARLGFSVAAHLEPEVLLVDEILSVGDAQFQRKCVASMKDRLRQGVAVLFISHNMPAVIELCQKTLVLNAGAVVFEGASEAGTGRYMELLRRGEVRGGGGPVEVLGWRFDTPHSEKIQPGEPFEFELRFRCRAPLLEPTFNLVLHRLSDQLRVYDMAAQECGLVSRVYQAGEEVTLRLSGQINLLRGVYTLGFNVFVPSEHLFAFSDPYLHQFAVQETSSFAGVVDLGIRAEEACVGSEGDLQPTLGGSLHSE